MPEHLTPSPRMRTRVVRPGERRSVSRSATRALDVLELFGKLGRPLRAVDIARALDLGASSTDQLLKTMVISAHLTFDGSAKTYLPSPRLAPFGRWMASTYHTDERIRRLVQELQAVTLETVTLSTPSDLFMQIIDFAPPGPEVPTAERGLRVSMFGTAIGIAYLSSVRVEEQDRLAHRARIEGKDLEVVREQICSARQSRIAASGSPDGRYWSLATPLPADCSPAPLVLGMAVPLARAGPRLDELSALILDAVTRV